MSKNKIKIIGWLLTVFSIIGFLVVYFNSTIELDYERSRINFYVLLPISMIIFVIGIVLLFKREPSENIIYWLPGIISTIFSFGGFFILLFFEYLATKELIKWDYSIEIKLNIFYYLLVFILIVYGLIKGIQGIKNNRKIGWINIILALISFVISIAVIIVTFPGFD